MYPLDENEADSFEVENVKTRLLNIRNEVSDDLRLNAFQKEQLYTYIDMQYATLGSIVNLFDKQAIHTAGIGVKAGFWKFIKRNLNKIVSVVLTTAISAAIGLISSGSNLGATIGGSAGFISSVIDASYNRCIKICGTGYCNTAYNDCYTKTWITKFTLKTN